MPSVELPSILQAFGGTGTERAPRTDTLAAYAGDRGLAFCSSSARRDQAERLVERLSGRMGGHRVLYTIEDEVRIVIIEQVGDRKDVYR